MSVSTRDVHCPYIHTISQDIERDLIDETSDVLPRIMHRLLYTLSHDRKVSYVSFFLLISILQ